MPTRRHLASLSCGVLAALIAGGGCGTDGPDDDQAASQATVGVEAAACGRHAAGLGVVVAPDLVVTNAHVVAGADAPTVAGGAEGGVPAEVVAFDPGTDLALLAVDETIGLPVPLGEADEREVVWIHTLPEGELTSESSIVQRKIVAVGEDIYGHDGARRRVLELAATVAGGDSGGGVFADDGSLVGVVFARSTRNGAMAYAVAASEVADLLDELVPDRQPVDPGSCL
jgi:S1-C subfamily serine protease